MNTNRDRLDDAIDRVAACMTRVEDNDALAVHILNALPERVAWFGWLFRSWVPRLAMIAIVVAAGVVWGNRREVVVAPIASVQPIATPTVLVASVTEVEPNRTMPLERLEPLEPLEPERVDFERSLPALGAVAVLELASLAPVSLPEDAPLTLAPLAIADLPLTAEPISPR